MKEVMYETSPSPAESERPARVAPSAKRAHGPAVPPRRSVKFSTGVGSPRPRAEIKAPAKMATIKGFRASAPVTELGTRDHPPDPFVASTRAMVKGMINVTYKVRPSTRGMAASSPKTAATSGRPM